MEIKRKYLASFIGALSVTAIVFLVLAVVIPDDDSDLLLPPKKCILAVPDGGCSYDVPQSIDFEKQEIIYESPELD